MQNMPLDRLGLMHHILHIHACFVLVFMHIFAYFLHISHVEVFVMAYFCIFFAYLIHILSIFFAYFAAYGSGPSESRQHSAEVRRSFITTTVREESQVTPQGCHR